MRRARISHMRGLGRACGSVPKRCWQCTEKRRGIFSVRRDDLKLKSSATLFALVSSGGSVFQQIIDRYFDGRRDETTVEFVRRSGHLLQGGTM